MTPNENASGSEIGHRIRTHRLGMDLSQTEYGRRYGVNQTTVSHWENNVFTPDHEHMELLRADGIESSGPTLEEPEQFQLPFEQTFLIELRIGPQMAQSVCLRLRLRRLAN